MMLQKRHLVDYRIISSQIGLNTNIHLVPISKGIMDLKASCLIYQKMMLKFKYSNVDVN